MVVASGWRWGGLIVGGALMVSVGCGESSDAPQGAASCATDRDCGASMRCDLGATGGPACISEEAFELARRSDDPAVRVCELNSNCQALGPVYRCEGMRCVSSCAAPCERPAPRCEDGVASSYTMPLQRADCTCGDSVIADEVRCAERDQQCVEGVCVTDTLCEGQPDGAEVILGRWSTCAPPDEQMCARSGTQHTIGRKTCRDGALVSEERVVTCSLDLVGTPCGGGSLCGEDGECGCVAEDFWSPNEVVGEDSVVFPNGDVISMSLRLEGRERDWIEYQLCVDKNGEYGSFSRLELDPVLSLSSPPRQDYHAYALGSTALPCFPVWNIRLSNHPPGWVTPYRVIIVSSALHAEDWDLRTCAPLKASPGGHCWVIEPPEMTRTCKGWP